MDWLLLLLAGVAVYLLPGLLVVASLDLSGSTRIDRLALSLVASDVILPFAFVSVGSFARFRPGPVSLAMLLGALAVVAIWTRAHGRRPRIAFQSRVGSSQGPSSTEARLSVAFIVAFAAIANAPRLATFVGGGQAPLVATYDETFHMAQLTAVAANGVPPRHYNFPAAELSYYYWSWVSPATVGNFGIPLARAMSLHGFMVVLSFLLLIYSLLLRNVGRRRSRLLGLAFFTFVGGFDLYAALGSEVPYDWWQTTVGWLVSDQQISQWITTYIWVPQHLAAATAVLLFFYGARHLRTDPRIWLPATAVLLCFVFGASAFVFIGFGLMLLLLIGLDPGALLALWSRHRRWFALAAGLLLLGGWHQALLSTDRGLGLGFSPFRVPLLEDLRGSSPATVTVDRLFTLAFSPLVLGLVYLIEFGLPLPLFIGWLTRAGGSDRGSAERRTDRLMSIYPLLFGLVSLVVSSVGTGNNLVMRGMLPAQLLIVFAGLLYFDRREVRVTRRETRAALVHLVAGALVLQTLSAAAEWRARSKESISAVFDSLGRADGPVGYDRWEPRFRYVPWLNANSPADALVIEEGCPEQDGLQYRLLERARRTDPRCASAMQLIARDQDFIQLGSWREIMRASGSEPDLSELARDPQVTLFARPVYLVSWSGESTGDRPILYQDQYVEITQLR